jgi:plastocyanin
VKRIAVIGLFFFATAVATRAAPVSFQVVDASGHPVADTVVSLTALDGQSVPKKTAERVEVIQRGQEFSPFVTAVEVGAAVNFPNRDTVQHHVYSLSKAKKFELPLYAGEAKEAVVFDKPGVVALGCNIHDWMAAYVVVLDTPWFAKTGSDGNTRIDATPGRYRVEVWHPRLAKTETRELVVTDAVSEPVRVVLTLKPERRIKRTHATGTGGYR